MPTPVGPPLVLAHDTHRLEANLGIRRDGSRVGDGRVDNQAVVAAPLEEEPREQADRLGPRPRPCQRAPR